MRDEVRSCSVCEATTAHQWRGVPWPTLLGATLAGLGTLATFTAGPLEWPASLPVAFAGALLVLRDRQARWDIACGRCRAKARALRRWSWLRTTEVHLF